MEEFGDTGLHRGYFKVWRKIEDSGLYQMPNTLALFMFMLSKAMHKDCKVGTSSGVIDLSRGQYISGRKQLAADLKLTEREIRTSLSRLIELQIIDQQTTSKYSIYTIVNYGKYQDCDQKTTSTVTSKRPANDQQTTTKEECKNEKNVNKPNTTAAQFDLFWKSYPKKIGKDAAIKAWSKAKPNIESVLAALEWQKSCEQWLKDGGQFVPNPATYLNQGRWMDEPLEVGLITGGKPWFLSWPGIEDKARSIGIEKHPRESDPEFRARVYKEAGLTPEEYRKEKRRHESGN